MTAPADEFVRGSWSPPDATMPGRRLRVFMRLVRCAAPSGFATDGEYRVYAGNALLFSSPEQPIYRVALHRAGETPEARAALASLPLRQNCGGSVTPITSLTQITNAGRNAELPDALQDLGDEIAMDVHEACAGFDDPDVWYPGADEGIEPVPDDHVQLVIAALQRELDRERRNAQGQNMEPKLPPAPLEALPRRVQRALAERRRLRFAQYGIGRAQWETGVWSLWDIPEDPDWRPRRPSTGVGVFQRY